MKRTRRRSGGHIVRVAPETTTITRAGITADRIHDLADDIEADARAIDLQVALYHAATGDAEGQAAAERRVRLLLQQVLGCLAAFAD